MSPNKYTLVHDPATAPDIPQSGGTRGVHTSTTAGVPAGDTPRGVRHLSLCITMTLLATGVVNINLEIVMPGVFVRLVRRSAPPAGGPE